MQVLASVPDLDIVAYLPLLLSSLMDCLTDPLSEVRSKAAKVLQVPPPSSGSSLSSSSILPGGQGFQHLRWCIVTVILAPCIDM